MNRRKILLDMRNENKLKGQKPCFISIKRSYGGIYNSRPSDFIMTIKCNKLIFQKLTFMFHKLKPQDDFELPLKDFLCYTFTEKKLENVLCLFTKDRKFIDIYYQKGLRETFSTEDNISRIIKMLEARNIKELNDGNEKEYFDDIDDEEDEDVIEG